VSSLLPFEGPVTERLGKPYKKTNPCQPYPLSGEALKFEGQEVLGTGPSALRYSPLKGYPETPNPAQCPVSSLLPLVGPVSSIPDSLGEP
jgi:hypothetical protein